MRNKIIYTFVLLCILLSSIYLGQFGYWLYIDNSGIPSIGEGLFSYNLNFLFSIKDSTGLGYDNIMLGFSRFPESFLYYFGDFFLYILFCIVNIYFGYKVLKKIFSSKSSIYGALIFTFNPVSLLFLNLTGFIFAYSSIAIILYSVIEFIKSGRYKFLLLLLLGGLFLISYTRLLGIYFIFLVFLGVFYWKIIHGFIKNNKSKTVVSIIFIILFFIPFFFSIVAGKIFGDSAYFAGVSNYAKSFDGSFLYYASQNTPLYENFQLRELTNNFASNFKGSFIYIVFFTFFTLYAVISNGMKLQGKYKNLTLFLLLILFSCILIKSGGIFFSKEVFLAITYKYFPFIANNTNWLFLIYVPILAFLFSNIIENTKNKKNPQIIVGVFVFLSIFPILSHIIFGNNYKLETLTQSDYPSEYRLEFFSKNDKKEVSVFYPSSNLAFSWSPYPISVLNNNNYTNLLSDNVRLVNEKQWSLAKVIQDLDGNFQNLSILNNKNIFVFKNIYNPEIGYFDYYSLENLVEKSQNIYSSLVSGTGYTIEDNNKEFLKIRLGKNDYEYFLYPPKTIINSEIDTFFDEEIDINTRPIVIDSESFYKPEIMGAFEIPQTNQDIRIDYKRSTRNPTKIYTKISNVDTSQDFMLQLNQTFGMSWKLKWIDTTEYQRYNCLDSYEYFPITNNSFCYFEDGYLDSIGDYRYLNNPEVKKENHFEGNFVGNTWLVEPSDIRSVDTNKSELYAVVIYEKQFWYMLTLWISFGTLGLLILAAAAQEFYLLRKGNSEK